MRRTPLPCPAELLCTWLVCGSYALVAGCAGVEQTNLCGDTSEPAVVELTSSASNRFRVPVDSVQVDRYQQIVRQQRDYSCGAAALSTVLVYYFQDAVSEQQVLDAIFWRLEHAAEGGRQAFDDRVRNGLSLLDLQQAAADLGYQSAVASMTLDEARLLEAPVVVRLARHDFLHFVVLKGIVDGRVFLADPIRGNLRMSEEAFCQQWNDVALFLGKDGFGLPAVHPLSVDAVEPVQMELETARRSILRWP